jgi:hypothetical protein
VFAVPFSLCAFALFAIYLLVREQPRYKVIQNITQYTNLQLFFSETFISLVLQNSIRTPFAKQKQAVSALFHPDL